MTLAAARHLGTQAASLGWSRERLSAYLAADGYAATGLTARRVGDAYAAQVARG